MNLKQHFRAFAGETAIYGGAAIAAKAVGVFLVPIYTRFLSPEEYGVIGLLGSASGLVLGMAILGLDSATHTWYWNHTDEESRRGAVAGWFWGSMVLAGLFAVFFCSFSKNVSQALFSTPRYSGWVEIAAVTVPLGIPGNVLSNWLRLRRQVRATAYVMLATLAGTSVLSILLIAVYRQGGAGSLVANLAVQLLVCGAAIWVLRESVRPSCFIWKQLRAMLAFGLPLVPAGLAIQTLGFVDRFFVSRYCSTADVGLYQVGATLGGAVALITGAFCMAWGPYALSIQSRPDAHSFYARVFEIYLLAVGGIAFTVGTFAPELLRCLTTAAYQDAATVAPFIGWALVFSGLGYVAGTGLLLAKQSLQVLWASLLAMVLNIVFGFVLTPRFGKSGAAFATCLGQLVIPVYLFWRSQQVYPIPYRWNTGLLIGGVLVAGGGLTSAMPPADSLSRAGLKIGVAAGVLGAATLLAWLRGGWRIPTLQDGTARL